MTLPSSGLITMNMINVELGKSGTAAINLNSSECRNLAGKSSGLITLADFYGKSNGVAYSPYVANFSGVSGYNNWPTGWTKSVVDGDLSTNSKTNVVWVGARDDESDYADVKLTYSLGAYPNHKGGTITRSLTDSYGNETESWPTSFSAGALSVTFRSVSELEDASVGLSAFRIDFVQ